MASKDLHNNVHVVPAIVPVATAQTDNTAMVSAIVDTLGYESAELVIITGTLADADATFTVLLEDGDAANLSDAATVVAPNLVGTLAAASFTYASDSKCFKVGYVGIKRYLRATITPANNTGNAPIAAVWVLGHPRTAPTSNPPA